MNVFGRSGSATLLAELAGGTLRYVDVTNPVTEPFDVSKAQVPQSKMHFE